MMVEKHRATKQMAPVQIETSPQYQSAIRSLQQGDAGKAKQQFAELIRAHQASPTLCLGMAVACRSLQDIKGALQALDKVLELEPGNLTALIMKGDVLAGDHQARLAAQCYVMAIKVADQSPSLPADLLEAIERVRIAVKQIHGDIQAHLDKALSASGYHPDTSSPRFTQSMQLLTGEKQIYLQQPRAFYFPELPHRQFYSRDEFNWLAEVEDATDDIRNELMTVMQNQQGFVPYIRSEEQGPTAKINPLLDDSNWSAFFLIKDGKEIVENSRRCPKTLAALGKVPFPKVEGKAPMVLFSALRPGTRIAPHHGFLNTRLICHLPLIVPPNCYLRVGNEVRQWRQGQAMIFDDSIEHEAWNDSKQTRVVLIFDIWRPELSEEERDLVSALLKAVNTYEENDLRPKLPN